MPVTYNDTYMDIRAQLIAAGISQPSLEARELLCFAAGTGKDAFYRDLQVYISDEIVSGALELLERRLSGEPLAYIIGEWEFMGITLNIDKSVLIPRTDTELLAQTAIKDLQSTGHGKELRILDLCTGSGCIGISIAMNIPNSRVVLADISADALRIARSNLRRHSLSGRAACVQADALKQGSVSLGNFDLIVSNPPYIPSDDILSLDRSVQNYEPLMALDGGADGLVFYRGIASGYRHLIKKEGSLMFECGIGQAPQIEEILKRYEYNQIDILFDDNSIERVIKCKVE